MARNKIEKLHQLTEFVHQPLDTAIEIDKDRFVMEAANVFNYPRLSFALHRDDAIELVKEACADTIELLGMLHDTNKSGYVMRYTTPRFNNVGNAGGRFKIFVPDGPTHPEQKETFELIKLTDISAPKEPSKIIKKIECLAIAGIIFDLIDDMPMDRLKRCREGDHIEHELTKGECNRLFIQQTGREKKFCSDYCKNKYNIRRREAEANKKALAIGTNNGTQT